MAAASLDLLPLELLSIVADNLTQRDISALSMVTKNLSAVLQSRLYSTIDMQFTMQTPHPLFQLLRTLLDKPWLAHNISTISLPGLGPFSDHFDKYADTPPSPKANSLPSKRLGSLIGAIGVTEDHACAWFNVIQHPEADDIAAARRRDWHVQSIHLDAVLALVVAISPNLVSLSLDMKWATSSHFLGSLVRARTSRKNDQAVDSAVFKDSEVSGLRVTTFHLLRSVAVTGTEDRTAKSLNTTDSVSWFYLPAIEYLSVSIDNEDTFTWPLSATPQPSCLTSLEIDRLREPRLSSLLEPLISVRKLRYNWFCQEDIRLCNTTANLSELAASISDSCPELEELVITGEAQPAWSWDELDEPDAEFSGSLAALSKLKRLKKLVIPWVFAMRAHEDAGDNYPSHLTSILSPSLENLELSSDLEMTDGGGWGDEEVDEIIHSAFSSGGMAKLRSLKEIILPDAGITVYENTMLRQLSNHYHIRISRRDFVY